MCSDLQFNIIHLQRSVNSISQMYDVLNKLIHSALCMFDVNYLLFWRNMIVFVIQQPLGGSAYYFFADIFVP